MFSLGFTPVSELRKQAMDWALSSEVKLQDFPYTFMSVGASSPSGLLQAWEYVQTNFEAIKQRTVSTPNLLDHVIAAACGGFTSEARAVEIDAFFQAHPLPGSTRKLAQLIEAVRVSAAYVRCLESSPVASAEFWNQEVLFA